MNANLMNAAELRALADQKDAEEIPIKEGFLKEDLYDFDSPSGHGGIYYHRSDFPCCFFTKADKTEAIEDFKSKFKLVIKKGTRFVAYFYSGEVLWFEENHNLEEMSADWANKNLENIRSLLPKKSARFAKRK